MSKKCIPLKCEHFTRIAKRVEDKIPVDIIVVNCKYRTDKCECENEKETLTKNVY